MVSTRHHPSDFPPPQFSPSKGSSKANSVRADSTPPPTTVSKRSAPVMASGWSHTPSKLTLIWLVVSLPLVVWDATYVFLRPHSMPGGSLHWPWKPYSIYAYVDLVYGFPAWESNDGFTAAQSALNMVETTAYTIYLYLVFKHGTTRHIEGRGAKKSLVGPLAEARVLDGRLAAVATLIGFATAVMTMSKTVLYGMNEACSGFKHIGHNTIGDLLQYWILPNGLWLTFSAYMTYNFATEILEGLEIAAQSSTKKTQ
ncbi:hypothetical protein M501DRAFT_1009033 [Patellaria atrata CBS 101060]|uniref:C6 transcription factor n=1 Tax=Patellaria atrata CBS 101060 TaxID=1346257 RepID=A0A9P4VNR6_9PEZI|nr:hypothetical protein M501DRAFT_1009033 [Patellaria atrata CBS 101060]